MGEMEGRAGYGQGQNQEADDGRVSERGFPGKIAEIEIFSESFGRSKNRGKMLPEFSRGLCSALALMTSQRHDAVLFLSYPHVYTMSLVKRRLGPLNLYQKSMTI